MRRERGAVRRREDGGRNLRRRGETGEKIRQAQKDRLERQKEVESWIAHTDVDMRSMLVSPLPPLWL